MSNQTVAPPGGHFVIPQTSTQPLLSFHCVPAIKPYLAEDKNGSILIDTALTFAEGYGTAPYISTGSGSTDLAVTIVVNGTLLAAGLVPINSSAHELPFSTNTLTPQKAAYNVTCSAKSTDGQTFTSSTELSVLPVPEFGNVTKMDRRTGALLVNTTNGWDTVYPIGFYTSLDYLHQNLTILDDLKTKG